MRFVYVSVCLMGLVVAASACQREDPKVKDLTARLEKAEKRIDQLEKNPRAGAPPRRGLDPNTVYTIPVHEDDVIRGNKDAKVTIVEGFDYACPYCASSRPAVQALLAQRNDIRVVSKQYVVHPQVATIPALAVCAAGRQGKAHELEDAIWKKAWVEVTPGRPKMDATALGQDVIEKMAGELGLDTAKLKADIAGDTCKQWLAKQQTELSAVGVSGTPAFFINGRPYQGARSVEAFSAAVDEELKRKSG